MQTRKVNQQLLDAGGSLGWWAKPDSYTGRRKKHVPWKTLWPRPGCGYHQA